MQVTVSRYPHALNLDRSIRKKIRKIKDMRLVYRAIGEDHTREIRERIARGVDFMGRPLEPLSEMTIEMRERGGRSIDKPLWETGRMKSSWVFKVTRSTLKVFPRTRLDSKKVIRDMEGGLSSIHKKPVPVRDAFSINPEQLKRYAQWIVWHTLTPEKFTKVIR